MSNFLAVFLDLEDVGGLSRKVFLSILFRLEEVVIVVPRVSFKTHFWFLEVLEVCGMALSRLVIWQLSLLNSLSN